MSVALNLPHYIVLISNYGRDEFPVKPVYCVAGFMLCRSRQMFWISVIGRQDKRPM